MSLLTLLLVIIQSQIINQFARWKLVGTSIKGRPTKKSQEAKSEEKKSQQFCHFGLEAAILGLF